MNETNLLSMRMFYLKHKNKGSCSYYAFTRKMKRLQEKLGSQSGITKVSPTLSLVSLDKTNLYLALIPQSSDQVKDVIKRLK